MGNSASRLITLIMLLQSQPNQKAADLAIKLGVSVRTLHRYVKMLDDIGIPIYSERGPYGGFSLVRGYKMPPLVFTPEEAVAIYLGTGLVEEMWGLLYRQAAQGVLAKLDNLLPDEQRQEVSWARRSLIATGMHRGNQNDIAPNLEKLRRAVRERRQITISYRSSSEVASQDRNVDPYALVHRWGWWYVVGYCQLRSAMRSFRVDRILSITLLGENFQIPDTFDVHDFLEREFLDLPQIPVRMRFNPDAAHFALADRLIWDSIVEEENGTIVVTFSSVDLSWTAGQVLAYGPSVEILEPEELRKLVGQWAFQVLEKYDRNIDD